VSNYALPQDDLDTLCSHLVCTRNTLQRNDKLRVRVSEPVISYRSSRCILLGNPEMYLFSWPFCSGVVLSFWGTVLRCAVSACTFIFILDFAQQTVDLLSRDSYVPSFN